MLPTLQPLALNSLAQALSKPVKAFNIAPTRTEISFSNRTTSFFSVRSFGRKTELRTGKTPAVAMLKDSKPPAQTKGGAIVKPREAEAANRFYRVPQQQLSLVA
ncbi:hypothetical protein VNO78_35195 [Psophocarpus tetragonolobus]|uniref:Uncharacterized protein n=1 Tax=Psophocarpus tetragonolobus TaxID=3891 RepID=A0AAN9NNW3_PSOTE